MIRKFVVLAVIAAFFIYFSFQKILTGVVAKSMQGAVGVPVKLAKAHLHLAPFEIGLYGLQLGNPPGFQEPAMAEIPEIFVRVNLLGLLKGKIHVQKVVLNMKDVTVERAKGNKINLNEFLKISKTKKAESEQPEQPPPPPEEGEEPQAPSKPSKGLKLEIDQVLLNIGKVVFVDYGTGERVVREFDFKIENMVLTDVADPFELVMQVTVIILKKVGMAAMSVQIDTVLENAKTALSNMFK